MSVGSVSFLSQGAKAYLRKEGELTFTQVTKNTPVNTADTLVVTAGEIHVKRGDSSLVLKEGANWQVTEAVVPEREANQLNVRIEADVDDDGFIGKISSDTFVLAIALPPANSAAFNGASKLVVELDGHTQSLEITSQMRAEGVVYMPYSFPAPGSVYGQQYEFAVDLQAANGTSLLTGEANMTLFEGSEPETPTLSVAIREDGNNDGTLTEAEVAGKNQLSVDIKLDDKAKLGDVLSLSTNGGPAEEIVLTQQHINQKSVTVKRSTPAEGESLNVEARLEAQDGGRSPKVSDSATVEASIADAPSIRISEDVNNNKVLNAAELGNQATISTEITLGDGSKVGDRLLVWQNGPKNIRGWKAVKTLTQEDINTGEVSFEVQRPPEGWTLKVKTMLVTASGEKSEQSAIDQALIDTTGPKLTISGAPDYVKPGETFTLTFDFDDTPKGFQASDIAVTQGSISGFTKVNNNQWTAEFTSTASDITNPKSLIKVEGSSFTDKHGNSGEGDAVDTELNLLGGKFGPATAQALNWTEVYYDAHGDTEHYLYSSEEIKLPEFTLLDSADEVVSMKLLGAGDFKFYDLDGKTLIDPGDSFDVSAYFDNKGNQLKPLIIKSAASHIDTQGEYFALIKDDLDLKLEVTTKDSQTGEILTQQKDFVVQQEVEKWVETSPLILDLDGDGVETIAGTEGVNFDINADGQVDKTGWVGKDDALLVRDINGDGLINDARELFGEATLKADGTEANEGFEALAELDSSGDGVFDSQDEAFDEVQLWQDSNSDGISQAHELYSLVDMGVASIDLSAVVIDEDNNGNTAGLRSSWTDTEGNNHTVDDIWFKYQSGAGEPTALDAGDLLTSDEAIPGLVDVADASIASAAVEQPQAQAISCYGAPEMQAEQLLVEQPQLDH